MNNPFVAGCVAVAVSVGLAAEVDVRAQAAAPIKASEVPQRKKAAPLPPRGTYKPPQTSWGDPAIAGAYNNSDESGIPFEQPPEFAGRTLESFTPEELAKITRQRQEQTIERNPTLSEFPGATSPLHWFENYRAANSRAWLVTDDTDGVAVSLDLDFVDMNNIDAVYSIVSHFQQKGHREIGMVRSSVATKNFQLREQGFHAALAHFGLSCRREHLFSVDSTCQGAYEDMSRILAAGAALPRALFISNDIVAFGCVRAFKEAGRRVPQDVSVIGFDDLPAGSVMEPPLTSSAVSKIKMGEMALRILVERIEQEPQMPPMKISISGKLVSRESVSQL
jgi:hypothetical protein